MSETSYQRRCAVEKAWAHERERILQGRGSRDWTKGEQREILRTGSCHGFEGHHMQSVKEHPDQAGNPDNIQFLTRDEHLAAHRGDWKNDADGKYNPDTGRLTHFNGRDPSVSDKKLSDPLSQRAAKTADNRYQRDRAGDSVKSRDELPVNKSTAGQRSGAEQARKEPPGQGRGITDADRKAMFSQGNDRATEQARKNAVEQRERAAEQARKNGCSHGM